MRRRKTYFAFVGIFALGMYPSILMAEEVRSFSQRPLLPQADPDHSSVSIIIRLSQRFSIDKEPAGPNRIDRRHAGNRLIGTLRSHGQRRRNEFLHWIRRYDPSAGELWHIHAVTAVVPAGIVDLVTRHPEVERVTVNTKIPLSFESPAPPPAYDGWNLDAIAAEKLWRRGYSGQGIVVAAVDTGVDLFHPALQRSWRGGSNSWFDALDKSDHPVDLHGHGTQVMGIICGGDELGSPIGVAPRCTWIAARIFDRTSAADLVGIHRALQWLLDPDNDPNTADQPDIVNNSWGLTDRPGECILEFKEDIAVLNAAGIIVIFAAGNSGPGEGSGISPANYPEVLSVGAVNAGMSIPSFSSRGPGSCDGGLFPSLVAPGTDILTCDLTLGGIFLSARNYVTGTSFAAAHVSGAAAVLLSSFPQAGPAEIRSSLMDAAIDMGMAGPDNESGYGRLNLDGAFRFLLASRRTADLDKNGTVDLIDLNILLEHWMQSNPEEIPWTEDMFPDGRIDLRDFNELSRQFGG